MGDVVAGLRPVALQDVRIVPGEPCPAVVIRPVDGARVGVGPLNHQPVRESAIGRDLQGVVVGVQPALPIVGVGATVERSDVERLPRGAGARQRRVHIEVGELVNRLRPDVSD